MRGFPFNADPHPAPQPDRAIGRIRRDVLDPELGERPADLGELILGDLLPGLGRVEVVAAPVGVQRARQTVRGDQLGESAEAALRAFLLDQEGE
jgi:hypothetical protein